MAKPVTAKIVTHGCSLALIVPVPILNAVGWNRGDTIVLRDVGDKVVCERVHLASYSKVTTGELQERSE